MALAMVFTTEATAQDFGGLDKSPMDAASFPSSYKVSDKAVRITYGRPQLKGRPVADEYATLRTRSVAQKKPRL